MSNLSDAKIEMSLQDAYRLVELIELGNFPMKAFEEGRGTTYVDFKRTVRKFVETAGASPNLVSPE